MLIDCHSIALTSKKMIFEKQEIIRKFNEWDILCEKELIWTSEIEKKDFYFNLTVCDLLINYSLCSVSDMMPIIFHFTNRKKYAGLSAFCSFDKFSSAVRGLNPYYMKELIEYFEEFFEKKISTKEIDYDYDENANLAKELDNDDEILKDRKRYNMTNWITHFCEDLRLKHKNMQNARYVWKGEGLDYRLLATNKKYRELNLKSIAVDFQKSKNI